MRAGALGIVTGMAEPPLQIEETIVDSEAVLRLHGDLDPHTAPFLADAVKGRIEAGDRTVVLDLSDVSFIDSSGLRAMLTAHRELSERDGELRLRNPSQTTMRLLEVTGLVDQLHLEEG